MIKIKIFNKLTKNPYNSILFGLFIIYAIFSLGFYNVIPYLLNYPPHSINTAFQLTVNPAYYWVYYVLLCIVCVFLVFIFSIKNLKLLKNYSIDELTFERKLKIREQCIEFSIGRILLFAAILPCLVVLVILLISHTGLILTLKICLLVLTFLGIPAIVFYIYSSSILKEVLIQTFDKETFKKENLPKSNLSKNILLQIFPTVVISIFFLFMMFVANLSTEIGDYKYTLYANKLTSNLEDLEQCKTKDDLVMTLNNLFENDNWFIKINDIYYSKYNIEPSFFIKNYIDFYATESNSKIYDSYGLTTQGVVQYINMNGQKVLVAITYDTLPQKTFIALLITALVLILLDYTIIYMSSFILKNNIKNIAEHLSKISKLNTIKEELLPITSSDELSLLTTAFNNVQTNTLSLFSKVKDTQDQLVEQERLASLGQMIGGIAHNLKTPIMSISGAAEGITDLVNEFDASIGNPVVNDDDFHAIAKDMQVWVDKIKSYTEYMSDVITAVKGQAVVLGNDSEINFTINELLKRVNILMKHELKNAVVYLNISVKTDDNITIRGDVNSLVQVINNMISNAIQAYNGEQEKNIDLLVDKYDDNHIVISIKDYGPGLPDVVKEKLFKEMITTKGKNGTGLGLYMSYSNIKAHFNGNITVDSEKGKGTTFNIILPL